MNFDFSDDQLAIRDAVEALCADFGDDYWLARDRDGRWPERVLRRRRARRLVRRDHAQGTRRRRPRHLGRGDGDAHHRQARLGGRVVGAPEPVRPAAGGRVRQRRAEAAHAAAADRRHGSRLLRRDRAQRRIRHHARAGPSPAATATATSSTARRSGPRPRSTPTRSCWWRARRPSRTAHARWTA